MALIDPRVIKQAEVLVDYSTKVKKGDRVIISADFEAKPLVLEIYKLCVKRGATEIKTHFSSSEFAEAYFENASNSQLNDFPQMSYDEIKLTDVWIAIKSSSNTRGLAGVDAGKVSTRSKVTRPITDYRVENTRWVITNFPTNALAQEANMSLGDYEDFVFGAINKVDWKKLYKDQEKLTKLVNKSSKVRILGSDTDLTLNIKGRKAINAGGEYNMPDGEVFTSVVENSANGYITYTYPAVYMGREFHNVRLEFKKGKVVRATASKGEKDLNKILDMDKGARFIGELGIGNNFKIKNFTKDILFDEKIGGSIHIALGKGYKETLSKNVSALHWDMIKDLRGALVFAKATSVQGGELWLDNKLVQKDGKWLSI